MCRCVFSTHDFLFIWNLKVDECLQQCQITVFTASFLKCRVYEVSLFRQTIYKQCVKCLSASWLVFYNYVFHLEFLKINTGFSTPKWEKSQLLSFKLKSELKICLNLRRNCNQKCEEPSNIIPSIIFLFEIQSRSLVNILTLYSGRRRIAYVRYFSRSSQCNVEVLTDWCYSQEAHN